MPYATPSPSTSPTTTLSKPILPSPPRTGPSSPLTTSPLASPPNGLVRTFSRTGSSDGHRSPARANGSAQDSEASEHVGSSGAATRSFRLRNHVRSYSHEGTPSVPVPPPIPQASTSLPPPGGYIFVQPATPTDTPDRSLDTPEHSLSTVAQGPNAPSPPTGRVRRPRLPGFSPVLPLSDVKSRDFALPHASTASGPAAGAAASPRAEPSLGNTAPQAIAKRPLHQKSRNDLRLDFNELGGDSPFKTPMLRKKSGELVRSSLKHGDSKRSKAKSAPATPMGPKYVHFDAHLEHVKHFLAQQRPTAVSRDGSPVETETEGEEEFPFPQMGGMGGAKGAKLVLNTPNFPIAPDLDGKSKDVYLRSLDISEDSKSLKGVVQVKNLAYQKWVAVRFTFDTWQTVSEVSAEYLESAPGADADRFTFSIKLQDLLARIEEKVMFLAIRYTVDGREIWDNNGSSNYRIEFRLIKPKSAAAAVGSATATAADGKRPFDWSVTTAGQAQDRMAELRAELNRLVGDDFGVDVPAPTLKQGSTGRAGGLPAAPLPSAGAGGGGAFSSRYDFGTSLRNAYGIRNSPRSSPTNTPRKQSLAFPSTFIGGMPATSSQNFEASPNSRSTDLPGFVAPYVPRAQRPPSPPPERDEEDLADAQSAPSSESSSQFPTVQSSRWSPPPSFSKSSPFNHLLPPRGALPTFSPNLSPQASPLASPASSSPALSSSPTIDQQSVKGSLPSPSPSESGSSSPESPPPKSTARGSPAFDLGNGRTDMGKNGAAAESPNYGHFVQNFCWGGALGLTSASGEPLNSFTYDRNAAVCSVAMTTPRSSSPLPPDLLEAASNLSRSNSPFHQSMHRQPISGS